MAYEIIKIDGNTWRVEDNKHVRFFLLTGTKEALLIDSGMEVHNAKEIAEGLTDLPVKLLITHADRDHTGSNGEFDKFYMHPSEASNYYNTQKSDGDFIPIVEGDVIDLGERPLEIIALPGHTPGSIAVLDVNNRVLISGDPIQDGAIFMFGVQREIHAYLKSLKKLDQYRDRFDVIYPSHGSFPVYPDLIDKLYEAVQGILAGNYPSKDAEFHGIIVDSYDVGAATFLMDKK
ncbi:MAG: MBL fold metallo-hydrolase [Lachnospiraceae bacterium]|nr:MBL fold metallo-hydrolase [Lachnospiraceae bacterium]